MYQSRNRFHTSSQRLRAAALAVLCFGLIGGVWAFTPAQASAAEEYPLVSLYFVDCCFSNEEAKDIAKFDLVVLTMEAQEYNASGIAQLRKLNPKIKIIPYVPSQGIDFNSPSATRQKLITKVQGDWYLVRPDGSRVSRYFGEYDMNITKSGFRTALADFVGDDLNKAMCAGVRCWDGVFYDVVEDNLDYLGPLDLDNNGQADSGVNGKWVTAYKDLFKKTRSEIGSSKLIIINGVSNLDVQGDINGRMFEDFPTPWHADGSWKGVTENVASLQERNMHPTGIIFSGQGAQKDYKKMRFSIISGIISGTYAGYDNGVNFHSSIWVYDEYKSSLGKASGAAKNLKDPGNKTWKPGVWRRDFSNGIAILNSTDKTQTVRLDSGYEKILGVQDPKVNTGKLAGTVTIKPKDGIILFRRARQIDNAPFLNGSFATIYSMKGTKSKTSFFPFELKNPGGTVIMHVPDKKIKVIADATYVTVYRGSKKIAKFAPYGKGFRGGVTVDVDTVSYPTAKEQRQGKEKSLYIVTGTRSGEKKIKLYSLDGKLKRSCSPFGNAEGSGVDVAIGEVLIGNKGKELVVGIAQRGSTELFILNNQCKIVKKVKTYSPGTKTGVSLAVGQLDTKKGEEIVTMPGPGASSHVLVFTEKKKGKIQSINKGFYAFTKSNKSGGDITVSDLNFDGKNEIIPMTLGIFNF